MTDVTHLFVYGTLKRGFCRHEALASARFIDTVETEPIYRMVNVGSYPGLVPAGSGLAIQGELWEVDAPCLARLDGIEGVSQGLYRRDLVRLRAPYQDQPVQTYFYSRNILGLPDCGNCWE